MQFLPVDALYATRRSCDGAEVVIEILDAPSRFGAEDRRSREWLRPLHNRAKPSTRGLAAVVIPTRGRTDALAAAIESVLSQDYPDKEVIVIDENEIGTPAGDFVRNHVDALKKKGAPIRLVRHPGPEMPRLREIQDCFRRRLSLSPSWTMTTPTCLGDSRWSSICFARADRRSEGLTAGTWGGIRKE